MTTQNFHRSLLWLSIVALLMAALCLSAVAVDVTALNMRTAATARLLNRGTP